MRRFLRSLAVCALLALPVQWHRLAAPPRSPAAGVTYHVDSTADNPDSDVGTPVCLDHTGHCTLRAAIMQANFTTGPNTITVPSGVYVLNRAGDEDGAILGDLDVTDDLTIQGAGSDSTIINGNGLVTHDRVFQILASAANVSLSDLTIRGGVVTATFAEGGGLLWEGAQTGQLHLSNVAVSGNQAYFGGGLFLQYDGSNNFGSVDLERISASANAASAAGGGIGIQFSGGESDFLLNNSQVYSNTAFQGGGIEVDGDPAFASQRLIEHTDIFSNTATGHGGGIDTAAGSATFPLLFFNNHLHHNQAPLGGAMFIQGRVVISQTTLDQNSASLQGGGLLIYNAAQPDIVQSTISENRAVTGGGIYLRRDAFNSAVVTMTNSTVSSNIASHDGGGVYLDRGTLNFFNTTLAANQVVVPNGDPYAGAGGGIYISTTASVSAQSTLIGDNTHRYQTTPPVADDCYGPINPVVSNLIETTSNCQFVVLIFAHNIFGQDPKLGPLAFNGGATRTHALLLGSPAIDAAETDTPGCTDSLGGGLSADQRGFARPRGPHCDIGAVEYYPPGPFLPLIRR